MTGGRHSVVTIKMISERCGLSIAAVSKALNGQPGISAEKAEQVRQVAREMGYYPNAAARTLKTNRSHNIGVLFQDQLSHGLFSVILEAARAQAERYGYDMTFLSSNISDLHMGYYEHAKYRQCDGVLIVQGDFSSPSLQRLAESELPVVSIDHVYNGRTAIVNDNAGSMEQVVRYLHDEMGHERIAFIHGEDGDVTRQRLAGFHRGCLACGIEAPDEYIVPAVYARPKASGLATRRLLDAWVRPTCILYPDDMAYLGGLAELESQGLSVPEDMSCFGYDGIHLASVLRPQLATYRQDAERMGREAADQLISAIERPKIYLPQTIRVTGTIQPGATVKKRTRGAEETRPA